MRPAAVGAATDDAAITARVKTTLLNDTQVAATKIDVGIVSWPGWSNTATLTPRSAHGPVVSTAVAFDRT